MRRVFVSWVTVDKVLCERYHIENEKRNVVSGLIIVLIGTIVFFMTISDREKDKYVPTNVAVETVGENKVEESNLHCFQNDQYLVVVTEDDSGRDRKVSMFNRSELLEPVQCIAYTGVEAQVLELEPATFVFGVVGKHVVLDVGTGPSNRALQVFDIQSMTKVYEDMYSELSLVEPDILVYWRVSDDSATIDNCVEYAEILAQDFTPQLQEKTQYSVTSKAAVSGETRCVATQ